GRVLKEHGQVVVGEVHVDGGRRELGHETALQGDQVLEVRAGGETEDGDGKQRAESVHGVARARSSIHSTAPPRTASRTCRSRARKQASATSRPMTTPSRRFTARSAFPRRTAPAEWRRGAARGRR